MDTHTEQYELYAKALRSLDRAGKHSEYVKEVSHPKEADLYNTVNTEVTRTQAMFQYAPGQFERIFNNPLQRKAYIKPVGSDEPFLEVQVWE